MVKKVEAGKKTYEIDPEGIKESKVSLPDDGIAAGQAEFFKALSDPARIKIIRILAERDICVCELMSIMDLPQTVVSHHLKVLKYAGIIEDKRWSRWMIYSLVDRRAAKAIELMDLPSANAPEAQGFTPAKDRKPRNKKGG